MKKTLSLTAILLVAALLLPLLSIAGSAETDTPIIDNWNNAYSTFGYGYGEATSHGNNQTRIAYTSSGVYVTCPTDNFDAKYDPYSKNEESGSGCVLYVVRPDGTQKVLFEDDLFKIPAGTTTNVMVDKNEDIWVVTSWDEGAKHYPLIAWHYDVSEDTVTKYDEVGFAAKGGNFGKPYAIMDPVNNKIYVVVFACMKSSYVEWTTFDIETKTWEKNLHYAKAPCACCYHFGYPDGKGGFFFATTRTVDNMNTDSDIEGLNVQQAMDKFQNRPSMDVGQVWDETYLFYVPDASGSEAYNYAFGSAVYDAERGIYPTVRNSSSDFFFDEATGLLYVLRNEEDCGRIGVHMMLYIFDTNSREGELADGNIFPLICKKEVSFGYGVGVYYFPHVVKDLAGNLYIVVATERAGEIEVWRATDEIGSEYEFVSFFPVNENYDKKSYSMWRSLIAATNRNNSTPSDKIWFLYEDGHGWESFSVDFAALRARYGL